MSTTLHLNIYHLPASTDCPATIYVRNVNLDTEFEKVFFDNSGEANEQVVLDLPLPSSSRDHKIEIKLSLQEVNLEKKYTFNLTSDGSYILLDGSQGIRFKQRFDDNFGAAYALTKHSSSQSSISGNKKNFKKSTQQAGFEYHVESGEKNFNKLATEGQVRSLKTEAKKKDTTIEDLEKLASLRDAGILTEDEFVIKKRMILGI
ncbi:hypothetical protein C9374_008356 [Naegleria lovaniensis]|uniref:SHOCT domain-containing protein n=1 Tax=Naegleria lovaniensis TaxID=51637 RepID=A0AA88GGP9_NAELO|nr:uncharacterized protein C9374_008356 [Naegleria lovaniensis]KAG2378213.1 hypothetical protein C9374_008356 [Naegleria lovaniensis]